MMSELINSKIRSVSTMESGQKLLIFDELVLLMSVTDHICPAEPGDEITYTLRKPLQMEITGRCRGCRAIEDCDRTVYYEEP